MPHEFLGKGIASPLHINHRGGMAVAQYEDKVHQSILTILSTARGERVMRPEFGCDLHAFVFAPLDTTTITLVKSAVRDALTRWEPRIELTDVNVRAETAREGQLRIEVAYRIRATNFSANLVYLHPQNPN